jgi:hypothetical protein
MRQLVLFFLFFFSAVALAQTTGIFEGVVTDPSGASVKGASVRLIETLTGARRDLLTGDDGYFAAPGLAPGTYEIQVTSSGFRPVIRRGLVLDAGRSLRIDFPLQLGDASQSIVVVGASPLVSIATADWGSSVTEARLDELPLNGRDLFDLMAQEPGVSVPYVQERSITYGGSLHVSVNGARPGQNSYRMDGIYVNDATGAAPSSASGQTLGIEAVQELRLASSPFLAEYGRAAGAMFTAVSKSGANDFHGSAYEFFRNAAMDAKNFFDPANQPIPPLKRNQFGGLLSGPVRHNSLFFLGNYEAVRSVAAQTSIATTLGAQARLGLLPGGNVTVSPAVVPFLNLYPLPNGALFSDGTGQFIVPLKTPSNEDYVTGKLDYVRSERLRFSTRYTFDRGSTSNPDPYLLWNFQNTSQYHFAQIQGQYTASPTTLESVYVGFSRVDNLTTVAQTAAIPSGLSFVPGAGMGAITVTGLTDLGGQLFRDRPTGYITNDYQVNYEISHTQGAQTLKAGAGFDRVQLNEVAEQDPLGYYQFYSVSSFLEGLPTSGTLQVPGLTQERGWRQNLYFVYAQDEIRITRRLQVTLGLRYEPYSTPGEVNGLVASLPDPLHDTTTTTGGVLFRNPSKTNFAPRGALAWDMFGNGKTTFRAGAGIFYDPISTSDLTYSGSRVPPYYNRIQPPKPPFPDLALSLNTQAPLTVSGMQYDENQPYVIQMQAAIEHQWGTNTAARVGYAGSHGLHLPGYVGDMNITTPTILAGGQVFFPPGAPLLNPHFGEISMRLTQFPSSANALQAQIQRRFRGGFRMEGKYAWAKIIDESSNPIINEYLNTDYMPTPLDFRLNRGLANFDLRHTFASDWSWETRRFLGGWAIHGILQAQTGPPFNPITGFDRDNLQDHTSSELGQRPNYTPIPGQQMITGNPAQWFNPLLFTLQTAGTYGNLGRDTLTGPGFVDLDVAVHKVLWKHERASVVLRVEMFNVANHPNFQIPSSLSLFGSTGLRVASAGQITQTTTPSRQLQLALRASF